MTARELTRDELLILLIEECGEVIQAATKCLRFGYDRFEEDYGTNCCILSKEIGEVAGIADALIMDPLLILIMKRARDEKIPRAFALKLRMEQEKNETSNTERK